MKIAVYGNEVKEDYLSIFKRIFDFFEINSIQLVIDAKLNDILTSKFGFTFKNAKKLDSDFQSKINLILSIGGDGTFLSAVSYALKYDIPIAGINCGRLGFLADISSEDLEVALMQFINGDYQLEQRTLLQVIEPKGLFDEFNYAINELTVSKLNNSSMIKVETYINGEFLANYWADGLIVATPTGSTAYSLSVGGPIVMPDLEGLIITPIASHNLTVRPVIVPDDVEIELRVEGRGDQFMVSFDHRSESLGFINRLKIRKAPVTVSVVKLTGQSFYSTLRNKLMWGADRRN